MSEAMREALIQFRQDARAEVFSILDMLARVATVSPHWGEEGEKCAAHIAQNVREHFQHPAAVDVDQQAAALVAAALALPASPLIEDEGLVELRELLAKACKLPWEVETEHDPDAEYGSGPDPDRGFDNFIVFDAVGQLLFGTATSDAKCIVEEPYGDEDGYRRAWDETGKTNIELAVAAVNFVARNIDRIAALSHLDSEPGSSA